MGWPSTLSCFQGHQFYTFFYWNINRIEAESFFFYFFLFFFYFKIRKVRPFHSRTKSWREKYFDTEISRGKKMNKTCTSDLSKLFSNFSALLCGSNVSFLSLRVIVTFTKKKKKKKKKKKERKEKRKKEKKKREKEKLGCNKFVGIWSSEYARR